MGEVQSMRIIASFLVKEQSVPQATNVEVTFDYGWRPTKNYMKYNSVSIFVVHYMILVQVMHSTGRV